LLEAVKHFILDVWGWEWEAKRRFYVLQT
jgi:hypothetical protein